MPRKKDENTFTNSGREERDFSPDDRGLTTELTEHRATNRSTSRAVTMGILAGLVFGLLGGAVGSVFVYPWYQENILKAQPSVVRENGRQIILDEESAIISAVEKVNPAVVSIVVTKDLPKFEQLAPFGDFFFQVPPRPGERGGPKTGAAGVFTAPANAFIEPNPHVVVDEEADYTVITKDGEQYPGKIL